MSLFYRLFYYPPLKKKKKEERMADVIPEFGVRFSLLPMHSELDSESQGIQ